MLEQQLETCRASGGRGIRGRPTAELHVCGSLSLCLCLCVCLCVCGLPACPHDNLLCMEICCCCCCRCLLQCFLRNLPEPKPGTVGSGAERAAHENRVQAEAQVFSRGQRGHGQIVPVVVVFPPPPPLHHLCRSV